MDELGAPWSFWNALSKPSARENEDRSLRAKTNIETGKEYQQSITWIYWLDKPLLISYAHHLQLQTPIVSTKFYQGRLQET